MVRLLWRTDVHLSDTSPASRKDDWTSTVLGKLRQVGSLASKLNVDAVLDGGDFFHVKSPGRNTHDLVRRTADVHKNYPCPVYANVGNHDCVYGDYKYIDQQPLGVLFSTGVFNRCYDDHEVVLTGSDGTKVRIVGVPYHGTSYDMTRFEQIKKGDEDFLVCMAHVLASPSGGTMFEGEDIIKYSDLTQYDPDVMLFGHWHKDQGVVHVGNKTVVNVGSLTRGSLSQDELLRRPAVVQLDLVRGKPVQTTVIRLRVADSSVVFDVAAKMRAEERASTMDTFVESLRTRLILDPGVSLEDKVREMVGVPDVVRERVLSYIEQAKSS